MNMDELTIYQAAALDLAECRQLLGLPADASVSRAVAAMKAELVRLAWEQKELVARVDAMYDDVREGDWA